MTIRKQETRSPSALSSVFLGTSVFVSLFLMARSSTYVNAGIIYPINPTYLVTIPVLQTAVPGGTPIPTYVQPTLVVNDYHLSRSGRWYSNHADVYNLTGDSQAEISYAVNDFDLTDLSVDDHLLWTVPECDNVVGSIFYFDEDIGPGQLGRSITSILHKPIVSCSALAPWRTPNTRYGADDSCLYDMAIILVNSHPRVRELFSRHTNLQQHTVSHELGHAFGLGHILPRWGGILPCVDSLMWGDVCLKRVGYGSVPYYLQFTDRQWLNAHY